MTPVFITAGMLVIVITVLMKVMMMKVMMMMTTTMMVLPGQAFILNFTPNQSSSKVIPVHKTSSEFQPVQTCLSLTQNQGKNEQMIARTHIRLHTQTTNEENTV